MRRLIAAALLAAPPAWAQAPQLGSAAVTAVGQSAGSITYTDPAGVHDIGIPNTRGNIIVFGEDPASIQPVPAGSHYVWFTSGATAATSLPLPSSPRSGDAVRIGSAGLIAALTLTDASGAAVPGLSWPISLPAVSAPLTVIYLGSAWQIVSMPGAAYSLPLATAAALGGVKIGANVSVGSDGTISVAAPMTTGQAAAAAPVQSVASRTGNVTLGVADVSGALAASNNLSDVGSASTVRTNLGLGSAALQPASAFYSASNPAGYIAANQTITLSGDITGSGATAIAGTLATVNTAPGIYSNATVNGKGLVTSMRALTNSDVTIALGFSPYSAANPSGYQTAAQVSAAIASAAPTYPWIPKGKATVNGTTTAAIALLNIGNQSPLTLAVPGVALGDAVQVAFAGTPPAGLTITAAIATAANTVQVVLATTQSISLALGTTIPFNVYWAR